RPQRPARGAGAGLGGPEAEVPRRLRRAHEPRLAVAPGELPDDLRRVALDVGVRRDVFEHDRTGGDDAPASYGHTGDDDGADAHPGALFDRNRQRREVADALRAGADLVAPGVDHD